MTSGATGDSLLFMEPKAIDSFFEAALRSTEWNSAIAGLADALGGFEAHFVVWNKRARGMDFSARAGRVPAETTQLYTTQYCAIDPCRELVLAAPVGEVLVAQRYHDKSIVRRHQIYNEFLLPIGIRYVMTCKLVETATRQAIVCIHRGAAKGPFTRRTASATAESCRS